MRLLPKAPDSEVGLLLQPFEVQAHQVAHLHILQVMPTSLIPGVQIGGVSRQGLQPYPTARAGHEFLDLHPAMDRRTIPDHQQTFPRHAEQVQEELDAVQPIQRLLPYQSVDLAQRRHRAHDGEVIARLLLTEDRRQSLQGRKS